MKLIRRLIDKLSILLFLAIEKRIEKNINFEISRRALKSTVDYVLKNMEDVVSVNSKWLVHDIALRNVKVDGLYLEFGVYTGDTINYISKGIKTTIFGFDSFQGLPEFWRDGFPQGEFAIDKLPKVNKNVLLVKGLFDQTLPVFLKEYKNTPVSYLHIDCDLYSSTTCIFQNLYDNIVSGTIIVFDEYFNYPGWENGEFLAFKEFLLKKKLTYKYLTYNNLHEQVAVIII